jgi:hypothetical protein
MAKGKFTHLIPKDNLYAMRKANGKNGVIVVFNFSQEEKSIDMNYLAPLLKGYRIIKQFSFAGDNTDRIARTNAVVIEIENIN